VSTRKILLIGHSQGTFYTNAIYQYLIKNGVPAESIAVYNLATPASYVEGGGQYLTSANDRVINGIRPLIGKFGANMPLTANITISIPADEINDKNGGHHFSSSYLGEEPDRIVSDITSVLGGLKAGASAGTEGCFTPPPATLGYKTQAVVFAVADPLAKTASVGVTATGHAIATAVQKAQAAAAYATKKIQSAFSVLFQNPPRASAGSQGSAAVLVLTSLPAANSSIQSKTANSPTPTPTQENTAPPDIPAKAPDSPPIPVQPQIPIPQNIPQNIPQAFGPALVSIAPGFGGGGGAPTPAVASSVVEVPPPAPVIVPLSVQTPLEGALVATSSITLSGTTTPSYSVVASYADLTAAATADADGNWSLAITLPDGTTAIGIVATDSEGNTSDAVTRTITVDTAPPGAPSASVSECTASLSSSFCLIPATTATLAWSPVTGTAYYAYSVNSLTFATTTETSAALSLSASASSTISVASYDALGNSATSTPLEVYVLTQPILINEIAWSGTPVNFSDEWIELKNNSPYALDLSRVAVVSADGSPYIQLSGTVTSGGFYLIESRAEATSAVGDFVFAFDELSNDGEELKLQWGSGSATTTVDRTPSVSECTGWCSGFEILPMTMERTAAGADGSVAGSWQRGISTPASLATDASGNTISGTPRAENSEGGDPLLPPPFPFTGEM
ncbi:MAG: lamin tail domain-containing protein, partial [Candidatus Kaiserbacteria bacterium]|nr:lamin tail domain-containing protein [Candidatus Kaiserbacteria bacterium]